jgi:hypothetical protein
VSPRSSACLLCGHDVSIDVRMALVEWREPVGREVWAHVPRCVDATACRLRVELLGEPWPVADGTPATVIRAADYADSIPDAPAEEVSPWLA